MAPVIHSASLAATALIWHCTACCRSASLNSDLLALTACLQLQGNFLLHSCCALLQLEDCKNFRQWKSQTPGHPENFVTEGIEVTTGMEALAVA